MVDIYRVADTNTGEVWTTQASSARVALGRVLTAMKIANGDLRKGRELHLSFTITNKGPAVYGWRLEWRLSVQDLAKLEAERWDCHYRSLIWADAISMKIRRTDHQDYDEDFTTVGSWKSTNRAGQEAARAAFDKQLELVRAHGWVALLPLADLDS
jgi:hypothetical protein